MTTNKYFKGSVEAAAKSAEFHKRVPAMTDDELFSEHRTAGSENDELGHLKQLATEVEIFRRHGSMKAYQNWLEKNSDQP